VNDSETQRSLGLKKIVGAAIAAVQSPLVWVPLVILASLTLFFRLTDADVNWVGRFYVPGDVENGRFPWKDQQPWLFLYNWGVYPAWIVGCGGLALWVISFCWRELEPWRDEGLFYFLLLLLGPGLLVNGILKPSWGRPRPRAVAPLGGPRHFVPILQMSNERGPADVSFPSGHATMGFYLMAPFFVYWRRQRYWAVAFLLFGLMSGLTIGLARVVAGGHFPSDVLWAGGVIYFSGLLISWPFHFGDTTPPRWKREKCDGK
jgi:membrane-associated PAP2 superfamily phosphatase